MATSQAVETPREQAGADIDDLGIEAEDEDPEERITEPFDPERIKISTKTLTLDQIITRIQYNEIDLAPDFQRKEGIWTQDRKSRLIESLLLRIPIPVFYVAEDDDERWAVVDGVQRISTIHKYATNQFPLTQLQYLKWLDGQKYEELPRQFQRRIGETQIVVNVIESSTPTEVMFNVFVRINTGGMTLNGQEIRHAINPGPVRKYLDCLSKSEEFTKATDDSVNQTRMADRECVLRFLAFHVESWEEYNANDLDAYLGNIMKKINKMTTEIRDEFSSDFKKAMRAAYDIFGKEAFRKPPGENNRRRPVNRALLEAWGVQLARCSPEQISILVKHREDVKGRFDELARNDSEFDNSISYSTSSPRRVKKRFQSIEQLVMEFV